MIYDKKQIWLVSFICFISLLYSLPNFYPERPSVEVITAESTSVFNAKLDKLKVKPLKISASEDGYELMFASTDQQLQARDRLAEYKPAINLIRDYPKWLSLIGAKPMSLGLDLRGGVHFLLQIDLSDIKIKSDSHDLSQIKADLKSSEVRYTSINTKDHDIHLTLLNTDQVTKALSYFHKNRPDLHTEVLSKTTIELKPMRAQKDQEYSEFAVQKTLHALNKRVNEMGIAEASVSRVGKDQISIDLPGIQDINKAKSLIGKTATLRFQIVQPDQSGDFSNNQVEWLKMKGSSDKIAVYKDTVLSGDAITYASASLQEGRPIVSIRLAGHEQHRFHEATSNNVGNRMAVIYVETKASPDGSTQIQDAHVISSPVIRSALGSEFMIDGMGSYQEASELALLLRAGALAAPVPIVEEVTIGPSLGEANISKGVISLLVGSILVFAFMIYYYRFVGLIANIALILNIFIIMATLSLLGATLTLPGIAGIVLTVGMAVDANVLINERIREEIRNNKAALDAISQGYSRAFSSIFDANMTTLITAMVLFGVGSGSVKGFAITLTIGLLASMLTAIYCTRSLLTPLVSYNKKLLSMSTDWFSHIPKTNFMALSSKAMIFSVILFLSSMFALWQYGLNLGLDFTGGTQLEVSFKGPMDAQTIRESLSKHELNPSVQAYGTSKNFMLRFSKLDGETNTLAASVIKSLPQAAIERKEFIGPQVGDNLVQGAILAVVASLIITMIYIAFRFEVRFAISALVSLIHDPIVIMGVFAITGLEFNLISLAALLTVLGYSLNDTIVVYDRVRENFQKNRKLKPAEAIDNSINQTLSRTIMTSALTLIVVLALALLGGEVLFGFSIALIVGILVGTYSSIYVAGSLSVAIGLESKHLIKIKKVKPAAIV